MPPFAALMLLAVPTLAAVGLLAVWVGAGRGPWFLRAAVLGGLIAAWLLIPAPEPVVVFTVQVLLVAPAILLARRWRERSPERRWIQFTIRDMLLLTVLVAVVTTAAVNAPAGLWTSWDWIETSAEDFKLPDFPPLLSFLEMGITAAAGTLLAAWVVLGRCRLWKRLAVLLLGVPALAIAGNVAFFLQHPKAELWPRVVMSYFGERFVVHLDTQAFLLMNRFFLQIVVTVLWLGILVLLRRTWAVPRRRGRKAFATGLFLLASAVVFLPPACSYVALVTLPAIPDSPLPEPNGYDTLCGLGEQFEASRGNARWIADNPFVPVFNQNAEPEDMKNPDELRLLLDKSRETLLEAELALSRKCRVPVEFNREYFEDGHSIMNWVKLRSLASGLLCKARLAFLEGDHTAFVRHCLDTVRLGRAASQGGLRSDLFVGRLIQYRAFCQLHHRVGTLSPAIQRRLATDLKEILASQESLDAVRRREYVMAHRTHTWYGRLAYFVTENRNMEDPFAAFYSLVPYWYNDAPYCILQTEIALANYFDDHLGFPESLDQLTPAYLPEPIKDPYSGKDLIYRRTGPTGYQLYSVGPNGIDDGQKMSDPDRRSTTPDADDIWFWQRNPDSP